MNDYDLFNESILDTELKIMSKVRDLNIDSIDDFDLIDEISIDHDGKLLNYLNKLIDCLSLNNQYLDSYTTLNNMLKSIRTTEKETFKCKTMSVIPIHLNVDTISILTHNKTILTNRIKQFLKMKKRKKIK